MFIRNLFYVSQGEKCLAWDGLILDAVRIVLKEQISVCNHFCDSFSCVCGEASLSDFDLIFAEDEALVEGCVLCQHRLKHARLDGVLNGEDDVLGINDIP